MSLHAHPASLSSAPEEMWTTAFNELGQRMRYAFARPESYLRALAYLQGLMGLVERKNGWQVMAYVLIFAPADTSLEEMVEAFGVRWTVEQCFEEGKGEVGLDEYEVRSWHGWFRHITLSMVALAFLAALRANGGEGALKKSLNTHSRCRSQIQLILFNQKCLLTSPLWFP